MAVDVVVRGIRAVEDVVVCDEVHSVFEQSVRRYGGFDSCSRGSFSGDRLVSKRDTSFVGRGLKVGR